jgi:Holliday junction resolvase RusA-like endonuclease
MPTRRCCAPDVPLDCAVAVQVRVYVERPLWHYRKAKAGRLLKLSAPSVPASGRDLDKILRAVLDCGTGLWWRDDSRVAQAMIERLWADGTAVHTEVRGSLLEMPAPVPVGQVEMALAERE